MRDFMRGKDTLYQNINKVETLIYLVLLCAYFVEYVRLVSVVIIMSKVGLYALGIEVESPQERGLATNSPTPPQAG